MFKYDFDTHAAHVRSQAAVILSNAGLRDAGDCHCWRCVAMTLSQLLDNFLLFCDKHLVYTNAEITTHTLLNMQKRKKSLLE